MQNYNTKSHGDYKFVTFEIPPPRRDHTLTLNFIDNKIYLFGGWNSMTWGWEENEFNEIWTLDSSKIYT